MHHRQQQYLMKNGVATDKLSREGIYSNATSWTFQTFLNKQKYK